MVEEQSREERQRFFPDYLVLGYGLCSNGVVGLEAGEIPLVIPRTDDCIGLMLGSQQRYLELFDQNPGTYWFSHNWQEHAAVPSRKAMEQRRAFYAEQYGEENADFLLEQDLLWTTQYRHAGLIASPLFDNRTAEERPVPLLRKTAGTFFRCPATTGFFP